MKLSIPDFPLKVLPVFMVALLFFAALPNQATFAQTETDTVYMEVDEMPTPKGGIDGWNAYLAKT